jgi:asparagine synthase (glutamine-hydrolysing)
VTFVAGSVSWDGGSPSRELARMLAPIAHIADSFESAVIEPAALLVTTVQDESSPALWQSSSFGNNQQIALVADCRLDDVEDLRLALGCPAGTTDATLLGLGYERWGFDLPHHLFGDYAFVLWDSHSQLLFASRDPFGVKPLVYARARSRFYVASAVEMLLGTPAVSRVVSESSIIDYLGWNSKKAEQTFFRDIFNVPGGHSLIARSDSTRIVRHWHPPDGSVTFSSTEDYHQEFRRLFRKAVKARLKDSTVIHVSGGLDSSSIFSVAGQLVQDGEIDASLVRGAAALHPGLACDEQRFIRAVACHVNIPIETWDGTQSLNLDLEDPIVAAPGARVVLTGGTQGDVEIARSVGAKALINGSGGDQLGIPTGVLTDLVAHRKWREAFRHTFLFSGATLPRGLERAGRVLANFVPETLRSELGRLRRKPRLAPWLNPDIGSISKVPADRSEHPVRDYSFVQKHHWRELTSGRLPISIDGFQRHSYRHQLESRFPFLDRALATFVMSIPYDHWPPPYSDERLHRQALFDILPPTIATRRTKADFTPALARRVDRALPLIRDIFWGKEWLAGRFVDQGGARDLLAKLEASPGSQTFSEWYGAWSIVTLEAWLRGIKRYSPRARSEENAIWEKTLSHPIASR